MMIILKNIGIAGIAITAWWQLAGHAPCDPAIIIWSSIPFLFVGYIWANWHIPSASTKRSWQITVKFLFAALLTGATLLAFIINLPQCPTHVEYIETKQ